LPVPFFPVTMLSLPSRAVASMLSCDSSLVSPRLMGRLWLILTRLSSAVVGSRLMVDWLLEGSHVLAVVSFWFSRLARILQTSRRASWMYVMWLPTSSGSRSCPFRFSSFVVSLSSSSSMPGTLANWTSMTWTIRALFCLVSSIIR